MKKLIQTYNRFLKGAFFCLLITQANNSLAATVEVSNTYSGWFSHLGGHTSWNQNYYASENSEFVENMRNFFIFDVSAIDVNNAVGATFTINTYDINYSGTFTLYDVSTSSIDLQQSHGWTLVGQAIYNDLGSGDIYGSVLLEPSDSESLVTITLNSNFINALKSSNGTISIGGTFVASPSISDSYRAFANSDFNAGNVLAISMVPEPVKGHLLAIGLLFVGAATLKRRSCSN